MQVRHDGKPVETATVKKFFFFEKVKKCAFWVDSENFHEPNIAQVDF